MGTLQNLDLLKVASRVVDKCLGVRAGERVCVVTDTNKVEIAGAFLEAAHTRGAEAVLVVMSPRKIHGEEPPEMVGGAMKAADVVIQPVTYAMTHTNATRDAMKAKARILVLRGVTEDMMVHGAINADYDEIHQLTGRVAALLSRGRKVRVTSDQGTDLTLSIEGRPALTLGGKALVPGIFAAMPDGEAAISPVEGTAEGVWVIEHAMDSLGLLDAPIRVEVQKGRAVSIRGGRSAEELQRIIHESDENASNIAEFAIGTNSQARLIGNLAEDKKRIGTVHIAVGDNHVIGGHVTSNIHLDGMLLRPTVLLDNEVVVERGQLRVA